MSQGLAQFHAALKELLGTSPALAAWAAEHFGATWIQLDGNRELRRLRPGEYPAQIFELADGTSAPLTMNGRQRTEANIGVAIAWSEADPAVAFGQRVALPDLVTRAVMGDRRLGGAVEQCWVSGFEPLQAEFAGHVHLVRFTVSGQYTVR